jgi:hypothetical protein
LIDSGAGAELQPARNIFIAIDTHKNNAASRELLRGCNRRSEIIDIEYIRRDKKIIVD